MRLGFVPHDFVSKQLNFKNIWTWKTSSATRKCFKPKVLLLSGWLRCHNWFYVFIFLFVSMAFSMTSLIFFGWRLQLIQFLFFLSISLLSADRSTVRTNSNRKRLKSHLSSETQISAGRWKNWMKSGGGGREFIRRWGNGRKLIIFHHPNAKKK
jgi:hypothetical protein